MLGIVFAYGFINEEITDRTDEKEESSQLTNVEASLEVDFQHITYGEDARVSIHWWYNKEDEKYYFFFPAAANLSDVIWEYDEIQDIYIDGVEIKNGAKCAVGTGEHVLYTADGLQVFKIVVMQSENIGTMFLTTESGNLGFVNIDKEHKESGNAVIIDAENNCIYNGKVQSLSGRGNTTWASSDKRGYKLKFANEEDFFGLGAAKNWVLLANYFDDTLVRNDFTFQLAQQSGMDFTPDSVFIDLYMNGCYWGNYQLTGKIEVGEERVNIPNLEEKTEDVNKVKKLSEYDKFGMENLEGSNTIPGTSIGFKIPSNPLDITGGYLLEYDLGERYLEEDSGFTTKLNQAVVIKSPQYASREQLNYIAERYQEFEDAVTVYEGINEETKKPYYDYIDLNSYAKAYLIEEITKNIDAAISSRYFYKYPDSYSTKFYAGPIWDYDFALGNYGEVMSGGTQPEEMEPAGLYAMEDDGCFNVWYALYYRPEFQETFKKEYWDTFRKNALDGAKNRIPQMTEYIVKSELMDRMRWHDETYDNYANIEEEYKSAIENLQNFIVDRINFLDGEWGTKETTDAEESK